MKVVINSDDFGYNKYVTDGIIYAYKNGVVTSTTAMVNMKDIYYAKKLSEENEGLGVGLHLNITYGYPITKALSLIGNDGKFLPEKAQKQNIPEFDDVYNEYEAQYKKFIEIFNKKPTHVDSHHYSYKFNEVNKKAVIKLSEKYDLKVRDYNAYKFIVSFYNQNVTKEHFIDILESNNEDIEIMCHVAFCDLDLYKSSSYNFQRLKELDLLCSDDIKDYIKSKNIELTHY